MLKATRRLLPWLLCASLAACSTVEKLNPFAPDAPKVKPAELVPLTNSIEVRTDWQASVGAAGEYVFSPAVVGESVFAAARDGSVVRMDGPRQAWRVGVGQVSSGGVGADEKLVAVGSPKGEIIALDARDGRELWRVRVSSEVLAAPAVGGGLVLVRSADSRVFAFDAADGKRRWVYQRATPALSLRSPVGLVIVDRVAVAGFPGGKMVAIALNNGAAVWEVTVALPKGATELERVADVTSLPVVGKQDVCAAAFQGRVACFDPAGGSNLWGRDMSSSAGIDFDERYVYVSDDGGSVHALDRTTGASIWRQTKLANRGLSRPLAVGGRVVVGDAQGYLHVLKREDGAFLARLATDGSAIATPPQRLGDGLLVQTKNGAVMAVRLR
ncbi:MAG: outer membrane protein assembly factor BamB [Rhodocyclaceae bacterium]|nr:outer membrane protein assembly factor BamB [Rhodocyclaceae bacterium]